MTRPPRTPKELQRTQPRRPPVVADLRDLIDGALDRWYTQNLPIVLERYAGGLDIAGQRLLRSEPAIDYAGVAYRIPVACRCLSMPLDRMPYTALGGLSAETLFRFQQSGGHGFVALFLRPLRKVARIGIEELVIYRNARGGQSIHADDIEAAGGRWIASNLVNELDLFHDERITLKDHAIPRRLVGHGKRIWT